MNPQPTMASLSSTLASLELSADQHDAIIQTYDQLTHRPFGLRGVWLNDFITVIKETYPQHSARFAAYVQSWVPKKPGFSYLPVTSVFLTVVAAARLTMPNTPLIDAGNALVATAIHQVFQQALLRPLVLACDGSYVRFMEMMDQSHRLFFDYGDIIFHQVPDGPATLTYEDRPAHAERYFVPGFWQGSLNAMANEGDLRFEFDDDQTYRVIFTPAA